MSHAGIRLRIELPGLGPILDADSDWLHMKALSRSLEDGEASFDQILAVTAPGTSTWAAT